jgi:hypothetical protein
MTTRKAIPFYGTCAARSELTLVSGRIGTAYTLAHIRARFAAGCQNLLKLRIYADESQAAPTTGPPSGMSLLRDYSPIDYLVGDDDTKDIDHQAPVAERGTWLKIYAVNDDWYDHAVDVQLTIDIPARGEE